MFQKLFLSRISKRNLLPWVCSGFISLWLVGCDTKAPTTLEQIKQAGVLHVITRNSPVTYFEDRNGETGFEYELSRRFAKFLDVKLQIETVDTLDELYSKIANAKQPIIGAAGLTSTLTREEQVKFSSPYLTVDTVVVYRKKDKRPTSVEGLIGRSILAIKGSSQADQLALLKKQYPELSYQVSDAVDVVDILQMIEDKKINIALVNSNELSMIQVYYPNVRVGFTLEKEQKLSWIMPLTEDETLANAVNSFFETVKEDGSLKRLSDRFYGHVDTLGYVGAFSFAQHLLERLPKYQPYFVEYSKQYKLDWQLLAAIGYQESHWDPDAVSVTGVKGLMMLTLRTAKAMGVDNRLDAKQSVMGAAKFFSILKVGVDRDVIEPDRTLFALAAYNMGLGHLVDSQTLAKINGLNPKIWRDINQVLPLLSQKQWYQKTRYGYARGFEAKQFVRNVRRYYDILTWFNQSQRELPATKIDKNLHIPSISRNENPMGQVRSL